MLQLMPTITSGPHSAPASLPLRKRPLDIVILAYLIFNLVAITYLFDLEQILIPDTSHFVYPAWPPRFIVDLSHWWGRNFDPLLYARPPWWRATIWIDAVLFGPYSVFAMYAFIKGRNWIRMPSIIYASVMLTNVTIIMSEEIWGAHATPHLASVIGANASWVIIPLLILFRMRRDPFPAVSAP
jgi:EXPERA (EXPanded EBP superfamily)